MLLKSNYDKIDFNELYKEQKSKSSFSKKRAEDWDKKAPSFNEGVFIKPICQRFYFQSGLQQSRFCAGLCLRHRSFKYSGRR